MHFKEDKCGGSDSGLLSAGGVCLKPLSISEYWHLEGLGTRRAGLHMCVCQDDSAYTRVSLSLCMSPYACSCVQKSGAMAREGRVYSYRLGRLPRLSREGESWGGRSGDFAPSGEGETRRQAEAMAEKGPVVSLGWGKQSQGGVWSMEAEACS